MLHARTKARQGGLVGEHSARLLFVKRLLTRCLVKADALRGGLQQKVVFLLHLRLHCRVIRLATRSQTLVDELRLQRLALTLQLRRQAGQDRLLRRHASVNRPLRQVADVNFALQFWPLDKLLRVTKLALLRATGHATQARQVKPLQI